jgi:hypothetical protein|tara:strand:+ start:676 stop:1131 length:456 start_codon:yes stop_codon:yes gene_type:complete
MADLGLTAQAVNAKKMQVFVGSNAGTADNEWKLLQNSRVMISHPVFREPTTGGTVVTYTGAPDHSISGSMLFTSDEWVSSTAAAYDFKSLLTVDSQGEVPKTEWAIKFIDIANTTTTLTFNDVKLTSIDISKSAEGAVKADITLVCPNEPT